MGGVPESVKSAFGAMRFIVTIGWSIYPLGYFFGYLCGAVAPSALNLIYNLADFVNKIAFCLVIWHRQGRDPRQGNRIRDRRSVSCEGSLCKVLPSIFLFSFLLSRFASVHDLRCSEVYV